MTAFTSTYSEFAPFLVVTAVKTPHPGQGTFGDQTHTVVEGETVHGVFGYWPDARDRARSLFIAKMKENWAWAWQI